MGKRIILIFFLFPQFLFAQLNGTISYEQAIEFALKNNFDIQLAKKKNEIAQVQNTYGNAGFLPKVDLNTSINKSTNDLRQEFSTGLSVDKKDATSNTINSGGYLTWTIFDGMKMFASKERLNLLEESGEISFKIQLENTLEQVTLFYFQVVKQEQIIKEINTLMKVTEERIKVAQKKSDLGSGSAIELLQAKLDLNAQKSYLIAQKSLLNEYKNNLLLLLKMETETNFKVDTVFNFAPQIAMNEIKQKIEAANNTLLFAQKNVLIGNQIIKEVKAISLPKLEFNSSYVFVRNKNTAGLALLNQNLGYNYGLVLSWTIFNGLTTRNQIKVAKIDVQSNLLEVDKMKYSLFSSANIAYIHWLGNLEILNLEEENILLAKQSLAITMERLKQGLGNYLEIRESQSTYGTAVSRLVNARFNFKQSETSLKKLMGELVK